MIPFRISQWAPGEMMPVHMTCMTCGHPIRLAGMNRGRSKYRVWTHALLDGAVAHNVLPAPSLIAELVALSATERTEES